ncbi:LOW QUALITY PROTEIN: hypothetical protein ACHAXS_000269 [Conticribra weissflogii]
MVQLDCINIATEVSLLSSHSALPREGHVDATLNIMAYLGLHHNSHLCIDWTYPYIDVDHLDWKDLYGNVTEPIPPNTLCVLVDSNYAGDKQTSCSCSGFLIYVNTAFVDWHLK